MRHAHAAAPTLCTHLDVCGPRDFGDLVDDVAHNLGRLCLGDARKEEPQLRQQLCERLGVLQLHVRVGQLGDSLLSLLHCLCVAAMLAQHLRAQRRDVGLTDGRRAAGAATCCCRHAAAAAANKALL
jgi:hypothetical protein